MSKTRVKILLIFCINIHAKNWLLAQDEKNRIKLLSFGMYILYVNEYTLFIYHFNNWSLLAFGQNPAYLPSRKRAFERSRNHYFGRLCNQPPHKLTDMFV